MKIHLLPFQNMRFLELQTRFNRHNVQALSCLFKSCPMLNILLLKIINDQTSERRVSSFQRKKAVEFSLIGYLTEMSVILLMF